MKPINFGGYRKSLVCGVASLSLVCGAALAQENAPDNDNDDTEDPLIAETIVVNATGLRRNTAQIGLFGEKSTQDIPFSVQSFSEEQISLVQSRTAKELIELDASVRSTTTSGAIGENFIVRGINLFTSEVFVDGLPGLVPTRRNSTATVDRIELFKGPSTILNGPAQFGNSAGIINFIPKRATPDRPSTASIDFESASVLGTSVDLNGTFGDMSARGYGTVRSGESEFDDNSFSENVIGGSIAFETDRVQASVDIYRQEQNLDGTSLLILPRNDFLLSPPRNDINVGRGNTFYDGEFTTVLGNVRYYASEDFSVYAKLGYATGEDESVGGLFFIEENNGDGNLSLFSDQSKLSNVAAQVGAEAAFQTGGITHEINVRGDIFESESEFGGGPAVTGAGPSNLFNPLDFSIQVGRFNGDYTGFSDRELLGASINDTITAFDGKLIGNIGVRYQNVETSSSFGGKVSADRVSPAFALIYKPVADLSIYGSYIEGLGSPSLPTSSAANAGEVLPPPQTKQVEFGTKYTSDSVDATLALFQTTVPNRYVDPITNIDDFNGDNRYTGIEANLNTRPFEGFRLNGSLLWLDAEQRDTAGGLQDGFEPQASPDLSASIYTDYELLDQFFVLARIVHTGSSFVDAAERFEVPSNTRVDLGARYTFDVADKPVTASLIVDNVSDNNDWVIGRGFASTMQPRTIRLSLATEF